MDQAIAGLAPFHFVLKNISSFLGNFSSSLRDEFLPNSEAVAREWGQSIKMPIITLGVVERLLTQESLMLEHQVIDFRERSYKCWKRLNLAFDDLRDTSGLEPAEIRVLAASENIAIAASDIALWQEDCARAIASSQAARPAIEDVVSEARLEVKRVARFPNRPFIEGELSLRTKWLVDAIQSVTDHDAAVSKQLDCCMANRRYYLTVCFARVFDTIAFPGVWSREQHSHAIDLHTRTLCVLTDSRARKSTAKRLSYLEEAFASETELK